MRCDKCGNEMTCFTYCDGRIAQGETTETCPGKICGPCINQGSDGEIVLCNATHVTTTAADS
jgi:hypothetical protein